MLTLLSGSSVFGALAVDCFTWVAGALAAAPGRLGALGSRIEATVVEWGWFGPAGEMTERIAYTPLVSSLVTRRAREDTEVRAPRRG